MRLIMLVSALAISVGCPRAQLSTWYTSPINGHSYAMTAPMSWAQAEQEAQRWGGHLATIRSQAEQDWLIQTFGASIPFDGRAWIGYSDEGHEGTWTWASGEATTFTAWGPSQPDNSGGNQNGATLWNSSYGYWAWDDDQNGNSRDAILEAFFPASFAPFGVGCQGSAGTPALAPTTGSLPMLNSTFQMNLTGLPNVVTVVVGVVGFSTTMNNSTRGSFPLPFDLSIFGMSGCTQYVSDDFVFFMLALAGQLNWSISIPANPGLAGMSFNVQGVVFDPAANPFGATVTNAGTGQIGL